MASAGVTLMWVVTERTIAWTTSGIHRQSLTDSLLHLQVIHMGPSMPAISAIQLTLGPGRSTVHLCERHVFEMRWIEPLDSFVVDCD
jgi:hypothetical protein